MGVPGQLVCECDAKVAVLLYCFQLDSIHEVGVRVTDAFSTYVHDCTFRGVKVHLPPHSPLMEGVQVVLEGLSILRGVDGPVDDTVVGKEPSDCASGKVVCEVINVYEEQ